MIVDYHPLTLSDLNSAAAYYNRQRPNLGTEFRSNPFQFPVVENGIRRGFVRRFPYSVLFRFVNDDTVRILLIRHHRRRPSFGLTRR